jgi:hypothetical protein
MKTDTLARHYDALSPWERLPLIMAANARRDEAEARRLIESAPRAGFVVPNYRGLSEGLKNLAHLYLLIQLDHLALYQELSVLLANSDPPHPNLPPEWLWEGMRFVAYLFNVYADSWRQFSAELHLDPDQLLRLLPGFNALTRLEKQTRRAAFPAQEAAAYFAHCREAGEETEANPLAARLRYRLDTVADVVDGLRDYLKDHATRWT